MSRETRQVTQRLKIFLLQYQQCINRFCTNLVRPVTECPYIYVISDVETTEHGFYARRLTRDHKADDEDEQQRIKEAGGFIVRSRCVLSIVFVVTRLSVASGYSGIGYQSIDYFYIPTLIIRVLGILAVSRSFGDHGMKDFVTAQ